MGPITVMNTNQDPLFLGIACCLTTGADWWQVQGMFEYLFFENASWKEASSFANLASVVAINQLLVYSLQLTTSPKQGLWSRSLHPHKDFKLTPINNYFEQKKRSSFMESCVTRKKNVVLFLQKSKIMRRWRVARSGPGAADHCYNKTKIEKNVKQIHTDELINWSV